MRGRSDSPLLDRVARGAASGMTRRDLIRIGAGAAAAAALPAAAWPTAAPAAKRRGTCPRVPRGTCPPGTTARRWSSGASQSIPSGVRSTFNGCGPESGIKLPIFGRTDPVPDRPLLLADFYDGCKAHDCCYGTCGSDQAKCDKAFLKESVKACLREHPGRSVISAGLLTSCLKVAQFYHLAVSSGGRSAWEAAQETACLACERERLCDGTPCPDDRECCFRTRESPDRGVCCPAGTTCYGHSSGFASCKPI